MFKVSILLPDEAKGNWKVIKAQASLDNQTIGEWIYEAIKKRLKGGADFGDGVLAGIKAVAAMKTTGK